MTERQSIDSGDGDNNNNSSLEMVRVSSSANSRYTCISKRFELMLLLPMMIMVAHDGAETDDNNKIKWFLRYESGTNSDDKY